MSAGPLRIGIAGLGFGGGVHLPVFSAMDDVEICVVMGRTREKAAAGAARCGGAVACTTIEEFLDRPLDAVVIAVPPGPAGQLAAAALERGVAVLAEKPIAGCAAEAEVLADRSRDRITAVDFEFRELESFKALHALVHGGALGRIREVNISWRGLSYAQARQAWSWKTDAEAGGGVLTLSGLHVFNLLEWLFGPVTVTGVRLFDDATRAFAPPGRRPAADTADLVFRTAEDAAIHAHLSNAARDRHGHRWEIDAEAGQVVIDDGGVGSFGGFTMSLKTGDGYRELARDPDREGDYRIGPVGALAERFLQGVRRNTAVRPAFDEGARAQVIQERVYAIA